jgi:signal transduction histidine kinase/ActR/RegA family two-component response regulator
MCLALIASLTTAWMSSKQARAWLVAQGLQVTDNLARQSVLALLYASGENARDSATATLAFPDVQYVAIFDRDNKPLLIEGDVRAGLLPTGTSREQAALIQETFESMYFVAPVYTHDREPTNSVSPFATSVPARELLGYVKVMIGKNRLRAMQASIFANNIGVSLLFAILLLVLLNLTVKRMIWPLMDLSRVMMLAESEESHVRADLHGPDEVVHMAQVFNNMMAALEERDRQLRQQNDWLETEVSLRTQELVQARDAALTASRHKSEFLANMSHELRTPMNAIIGYTEMVIEDLEQDQGLEGRKHMVSDLKRVNAAAHHLLTLINNILDLAKIEAGRMDVHIETGSLQGLADQVVDTIQPMMIKNRNHLTIEINAYPDRIEMDAGKLTQILLNLLSNAAKFTQDGQVTLKVTCDGERLVIQVTDTGIGMTREQQAYIFDEFRQLDMSPTRTHEGTGLGLAITRRFCELLGGTIEVESAPGQGSAFTVQIALPMGREAAQLWSRESQAPSRDARSPAQSSSLEDKPAMLVVDDDEAFLDILARTLELAGYRVFTASNSTDAVIRARTVMPMAITLDLQLSDSDGWCVLDTLKSDPVLREIPVIIVSVLDEHARGLEQGAKEYLNKPVERAKLLAILNSIRYAVDGEEREVHA